MSPIDKLSGRDQGQAALLSPKPHEEDDFYDGHQRVKMSYLQGVESRLARQAEALNLIYNRLKAMEERWNLDHEQKSASAGTSPSARGRGSSSGRGKTPAADGSS